jgi:hypothetical protein
MRESSYLYLERSGSVGGEGIHTRMHLILCVLYSWELGPLMDRWYWAHISCGMMN